MAKTKLDRADRDYIYFCSHGFIDKHLIPHLTADIAEASADIALGVIKNSGKFKEVEMLAEIIRKNLVKILKKNLV